MFELPEELLSHFVNALDVENDKEALSTLALVNRQFLDLVRERRGLELTIGNKGGDASVYIRKLHGLFHGDPAYGRSVKVLTLIDNTYNDQESGDFGWLTRTGSLVHILLKLQSLKKIAITRKPDVDEAFVDWGMINEDVKECLKNLFCLRSLKELELDGVINMPLHLLMRGKNLKCLKLLNVVLDTSEVPPDQSEQDGKLTQFNREMLEDLEVGNCGPALSQLLHRWKCAGAPFTHSSLKVLRLHSKGYNLQTMEVIREVIGTSGDSLEELHVCGTLNLSSNEVELGVFDILTFHKFPRLRVVDLKVELNHAIMLPNKIINLMLRTLRLKADHTLEVLRLTYVFRARSWIHLKDRGRWRLSNSILDINLWSEIEAFASLGHMKTTGIEIAFRGHGLLKQTQGLANLVDSVYRRLPTLAKRDNLEVYCVNAL